MKTYSAKPSEIEKKWYLIDAANKTLGRLSSEIAKVLLGKNKPIYTPHLDTGDFVVVINASKIRITGNKLANNVKYRHSGYPGGLKEKSWEKIMDTKPEEIIIQAVKGMLPRNRLARQQIKKLKVYAGTEHPHSAQRPEELKLAL
ncbi:MAG: 50S ribosomal protein L13 [Actinobacteria bacterium]|nr:MAG: 50S ribosomal protein L13 [Actinomycetota bacterium]